MRSRAGICPGTGRNACLPRRAVACSPTRRDHNKKSSSRSTASELRSAMPACDGTSASPIARKFAAYALVLWSLVQASMPVALGRERDQMPPLPRDELATQIEMLLDGPGSLVIEGAVLDRVLLARAYAWGNYRAVWANHPERQIALMNALAAAARDGIDPAAVGGSAIAAEATDPGLSEAARDVLLSDRFLRYAAALAQGQIDPATVGDWALDR